MDKYNVTLKDAEKTLLNRYSFNSLDEVLAGIGSGDIRINQLTNFLNNQFNKTTADEADKEALKQISQKSPPPARTERLKDRIVVDGVGNLMHHVARCCQPIPGDEIKGFITRGRGISIHRADCEQLAELERHVPERIVEAVWGDHSINNAVLSIRVIANDRSGLLRDITTLLSNEKVNVLNLASHSDTKKQLATVDMDVQLNHLDALSRLLARLNQLPDVIEAKRFTQ